MFSTNQSALISGFLAKSKADAIIRNFKVLYEVFVYCNYRAPCKLSPIYILSKRRRLICWAAIRRTNRYVLRTCVYDWLNVMDLNGAKTVKMFGKLSIHIEFVYGAYYINSYYIYECACVLNLKNVWVPDGNRTRNLMISGELRLDTHAHS